MIVGPENLSTIIPASDYVVEPSSDFDPRFPGHGGADAVVRTVQINSNVNEVKPDPSLRCFLTYAYRFKVCGTPIVPATGSACKNLPTFAAYCLFTA